MWLCASLPEVWYSALVMQAHLNLSLADRSALALQVCESCSQVRDLCCPWRSDLHLCRGHPGNVEDVGSRCECTAVPTGHSQHRGLAASQPLSLLPWRCMVPQFSSWSCCCGVMGLQPQALLAHTATWLQVNLSLPSQLQAEPIQIKAQYLRHLMHRQRIIRNMLAMPA